MSNFSALTFHPVTNIIEMANWMDDHFEKHHYGVYFSSDGVTYDPFKNDCERVYPKAADRISVLEAENEMLGQLAANNAVALQEAREERDELAAALRKIRDEADAIWTVRQCEEALAALDKDDG
jgi:hypothetical protein